MQLLEMPHVDLREQSEIPHELIAICAFGVFQERCPDGTPAVHGHDKEDWQVAEREVSEIWWGLDTEEFAELADRIGRQKFQIRDADVRLRAYYLSRRMHYACPDAIWKEAYQLEWNAQFAKAFLNAHRQKRLLLYNPARHSA